MAQTKKVDDEEEDWGMCFVAETRAIDAMTSINFERDWIVDSGYGLHLTGDKYKFSNFHKYNGSDVIVTTNNTVHQVEKEGTIFINEKKEDYHSQHCVLCSRDEEKSIFRCKCCRYRRLSPIWTT